MAKLAHQQKPKQKPDAHESGVLETTDESLFEFNSEEDDDLVLEEDDGIDSEEDESLESGGSSSGMRRVYFVDQTRWNGRTYPANEPLEVNAKELEELGSLVKVGEPVDLVPNVDMFDDGVYRVRQGVGGVRRTSVNDEGRKITTLHVYPDTVVLTREEAIDLKDVVEPLDKNAYRKVRRAS